MILFAAATGLRPGEWTALEHREVDLIAGVVLVKRAYRNGRLKSPKAPGNIRAVPLQSIAARPRRRAHTQALPRSPSKHQGAGPSRPR